MRGASFGDGDRTRVLASDRNADMRAVWFEEGKVLMIDQRLLPLRLTVVELNDYRQIAEAVRDMTVRGAPSIGAAAAYGMVLASIKGEDLSEAALLLKGTRPTAHDLFHAVDFMMDSIASGKGALESAEGYVDALLDRCRRIGRNGAVLIRNGAKIMTHCNAGALATVDVGTALAPIRMAWEEGKDLFVYVSETRPRMQGMRLTAWELLNEGIPHAIIADGASGHYMRQGVDIVITGADRIAANGDFANKIGTYEKAVLARYLDIPFYVAAPLSTFDLAIDGGDEIPIEHRSAEEVTMIEGVRLAPEGSDAFNPAFDVTPANMVTGYITERGILKPNDIQKMRGDGFEP